MSHVPYASIVGSLMYAMVYTRPNLTQVIGVVSRYMGNLRKENWQAMKCIFRYLKGTTNIRLVYHGDTSCAFVGYSVFCFVLHYPLNHLRPSIEVLSQP